MRKRIDKLNQTIGELTVELKKRKNSCKDKQDHAHVLKKMQSLLTKIQAIKADHPLWGYRRVWAYLRYQRNGLVVGKNTICRIMKENALLVQKTMALRAKRTTSRPKPRAKVPNQYWEQI